QTHPAARTVPGAGGLPGGTGGAGVHWQAHRGGGLHDRPDNTIAAFEYAWGLGGIPEADVQPTRDGVLVCLHDATLERTTDAAGALARIPVAELEYASVSGLDAGSRFSSGYAGQRVPRLADVLALMEGHPEREIYLDLKMEDLDRLAALIDRHGLSGRVYVASSSRLLCLDMKRRLPGIKTLLWCGGTPAEIEKKFREAEGANFAGMDQIQVHLNPVSLGRGWRYALGSGFLEEALKATEGRVVFQVFPKAFDQKDVDRLLDLGIRWYVTDEPARFVSSVGTWQSVQNLLSSIPAALKPGQAIHGNFPDGLEGGLDLAVDGLPLPLVRRLPEGTRFAAEYSGLDAGYLNAILAAGREIGRPLAAGDRYLGSALALPPEILAESSFLVSVAAGSSSSVWKPGQPFGIRNHDDFELRNARLEIPGGDLLNPVKVFWHWGSGSDGETKYREYDTFRMGDGSPTEGKGNPNKAMMVDFLFLPPEKIRSEFVALPSYPLTEGKHVLSFFDGERLLGSRDIVVDGSPPVIEIPNLAESAPIRGSFVPDIRVRDALSGVAETAFKLDGHLLASGAPVGTEVFVPGTHVLEVTAWDRAGNSAALVRKFMVQSGTPARPTPVFDPAGKMTGLVVFDPDDDSLVLELRRGKILRFDPKKASADGGRFAASGGIAAFSAIRPDEPPVEMISPEETQFLPVLSAREGFPSHRFDIAVPEGDFEKIEAVWKGSVAPGRIATLYVRDFVSSEWKARTIIRGGAVSEAVVAVDPLREVHEGHISLLVQDPPDTASAKPEKKITIAWWTDPQYYAQDWPAIYRSVASWLGEAYRKGDIDYLVLTGDIVNRAGEQAQWMVADDSLGIIDASGLPYGIAAGNHDVHMDLLDYSDYLSRFGDARFAPRGLSEGSWKDGVHHYDLVSFGGRDFIFLYLGYGKETDPEALAWASRVLEEHADRTAILAIHSYLGANGRRTASADFLFDNLVGPHGNLSMILCGHIHGASSSIRTATSGEGKLRTVYEFLSDYQSGPEGGQGFLRLIDLIPGSGELKMRTFSPLTGRESFFSPGSENFVLPFSLPDPEKTLVTSGLDLMFYGKEPFFRSEGLVSGTTVRLPDSGFAGLEQGGAPGSDAWYAMLEDTDRQRSISEMFELINR
ncbi:MAG: glycerophosphodiester phosphodiesterase family protein, partial [Rectinemataceae bacterium]|nr:glycerophosphodiester phosphodiesterase family protein [Rectinemataceae bacterium]